MNRSLLLLCGGVSTVYCASSFTQKDFQGVATVEAAIDDSVGWTGDPKWCGGRNTIRTVKFGAAQPFTGLYYPFFTGMAMLCYVGDHGFGQEPTEKTLYKLKTFDGWQGNVTCARDRVNSIDAIRSIGLEALDKVNGFGKVTGHCANGPGDIVSTEHPDKEKLDKAGTYYLTCPELHVLIGAQTAFNDHGFQRARAWCGSQMYYHYMTSYDEAYLPLESVGDFPPAMYFAHTEPDYPYRVTSTPVICEEDTFVSGIDFIRAMNFEIYNILLRCSNGTAETSMVSGPALVPEDKPAEFTTLECKQNSTFFPVRDLYTFNFENVGFPYGMPGMDVGCVDGTLLNTYHNSSWPYEYDDRRIFKHLRCPLNTVMAGYAPIYAVRQDKQGVYELQLLCRSVACNCN